MFKRKMLRIQLYLKIFKKKINLNIIPETNQTLVQRDVFEQFINNLFHIMVQLIEMPLILTTKFNWFFRQIKFFITLNLSIIFVENIR